MTIDKRCNFCACEQTQGHTMPDGKKRYGVAILPPAISPNRTFIYWAIYDKCKRIYVGDNLGLYTNTDRRIIDAQCHNLNEQHNAKL